MGRRPASNRPKRQTLTRDRVLRTALDLADERGIDSLTMRELGQRLGVDAMSLYNHVDNKDDLLNSIVDLVVTEIDLPTGEDDWAEAMRIRARSARQAFARHPWASQLVDSRTIARLQFVAQIESHAHIVTLHLLHHPHQHLRRNDRPTTSRPTVAGTSAVSPVHPLALAP